MIGSCWVLEQGLSPEVADGADLNAPGPTEVEVRVIFAPVEEQGALRSCLDSRWDPCQPVEAFPVPHENVHVWWEQMREERP